MKIPFPEETGNSLLALRMQQKPFCSWGAQDWTVSQSIDAEILEDTDHVLDGGMKAKKV